MTCCICGNDIYGHGHNPSPYGNGSYGMRCCDICNYKLVIPARIRQIQSEGLTPQQLAAAEAMCDLMCGGVEEDDDEM